MSSSGSSAFLSLKAENTVFGSASGIALSDDDDDGEDGDVDTRYLPREIGQIGLDGHRQSFTPLPVSDADADLQASPTSYRVP